MKTQQNNPAKRIKVDKKGGKSDEFGGYSKTWIVGEDEQQDSESSEDEDSCTRGDFGVDGLAKSMGLNINEAA